MNHADHVALLEKGVPGTGGLWADFGSGRGAFTLALAELVGQDAVLYSVDRNQAALQQQERILQARFPNLEVHYLRRDFTRPISLPPLDGLIMANSLHFAKNKDQVLHAIRGYLKPDGRLIIVEYDVDSGNRWVPHPLSFTSWQQLADKIGFRQTRLLATHPSSFLKGFYAALSLK